MYLFTSLVSRRGPGCLPGRLPRGSWHPPHRPSMQASVPSPVNANLHAPGRSRPPRSLASAGRFHANVLRRLVAGRGGARDAEPGKSSMTVPATPGATSPRSTRSRGRLASRRRPSRVRCATTTSPKRARRQPRGTSSESIGLVIPTIMNPIYAFSTQAVQRTAQEAGFTALVCISKMLADGGRAADRVDGLILTGASPQLPNPRADPPLRLVLQHIQVAAAADPHHGDLRRPRGEYCAIRLAATGRQSH
jgi:hypothetical protein